VAGWPHPLTTGEDIYGQVLSGDGSRPVGTLSSQTRKGTKSLHPWPSIRSTGGFLVVWQDGRNPLTTGEDIYGQLIDASRTPIGPNFSISTATGNQVGPAVAFDTISQRFLVVWQDGRNAGTGEDIYGQLITSDGSMAGEVVVISDVTGDQTTPSVAYGRINQSFSWCGRMAAMPEPRGRTSTAGIFNPNDSLSGDDFVISNAQEIRSLRPWLTISPMKHFSSSGGTAATP